ncbi:UNVERIFIED_CONTAM: hypothetical protein PYX00_011638 [Menopon gallinae]|uniref:3'-phosphate/5'-hydroxy nucleic acid ligase n=1 Tax=Menopon gallinae TaxID=328185 RepID=A0AAW2H876_9NEOP
MPQAAMRCEESEECIKICRSSAPGMHVEPRIFIDPSHRRVLYEDGSMDQIVRVAQLPGVVQVVGLPDIHLGYDFPIGCVAVVDPDKDESVVSPGGVGHDINCGVRTVATNLDYASFAGRQDAIAELLFRRIPTGMGSGGERLSLDDLNTVLNDGVAGLKSLGLVDDDLDYIESRGRMEGDSRLVSQKCKERGLNQMGSIGSGNHYLEIQRVVEIYDSSTAGAFGIHRKDQIVYSVHTGSRGLGHELCREYPGVVRLGSPEGQKYLKSLGCAANYAWANRAIISRKTEDALREVFFRAEFALVYDVSHNIAKKERLFAGGRWGEYLVMRKGASRAFSHELPQCYGAQQPIPVGGSMGTCSYILAGQAESLAKTAGSCCHGAGRVHSRGSALRMWTEKDVLKSMEGIGLRYGTTRGLVEEAPGAYKDVTAVVDHCEKIGITRKVCKVVPVVVFVIAAILLALFIALRPVLAWLYSPNTRNREKHPAYGFSGRILWIAPLAEISDAQLLSLIGLDSFMMLQTMKMLHRIMVVSSLITLPTLGIFYLSSREGKYDQLFLQLSIINIDSSSNIIYLTVALAYVLTFVILYMVYIYYKKYIGLRQAYIRNPSLLTAVPAIKKQQFRHGTLSRAIEYINMPVKTLYLTRLPSILKNDHDLRLYIDAIGAGVIVDCILIRDTHRLNELVFRRERCIRKLEKCIQNTVRSMNRWSEKNLARCRDNMARFRGASLLEASADAGNREFSASERARLFSVFLDGCGAFKEKRGDMCLMQFYLDELRATNDAIRQEKERLQVEFRSEENIEEMVRVEHEVESLEDFGEDIEFLPVLQILDPEEHYKVFARDIPVGKMSGFVTFESQKSANSISQSLLSSRTFSISAMRAPAPEDLIWPNLTMGAVRVYVNRIISFFFFIVFTVIFLTVVFGVASLTKIDYIENVTGYSLPKYVKRYESSIDGIVTPFIYNQLLGFSQILLTTFLKGEGVISYSEFQLKLMQRYFLFLFFNGFLALFFSSTFFTIIGDLVRGESDLASVLREFGRSLSRTSLFFCNATIQRCIVGNMILLVKPVTLVTQLCIKIFQRNRTRREKVESRFPENVNFATYYPILFLVFPMCLIYSVISPVMLLIGSLHFMSAYLSLKNEFVYVASNEFEAGGVHWPTCCSHVIYSLLIMHIATACQLLSFNQKFKAGSMLFPILLTIYFKVCLNKMFGKACNYHPINVQEEDHLDNFIKNYIKRRLRMLEEWVEPVEKADNDTVELESLNISDHFNLKKAYPYRDPNMNNAFSKLLLPKSFFRIIKFLEDNDKKNLFGTRK